MKTIIKFLLFSVIITNTILVNSQDINKLNKKKLLVIYSSLSLTRDSLIQVLDKEQKTIMYMNAKNKQKDDSISVQVKLIAELKSEKAQKERIILTLEKQLSTSRDSLALQSNRLFVANENNNQLQNQIKFIELKVNELVPFVTLSALQSQRIDSLNNVLNQKIILNVSDAVIDESIQGRKMTTAELKTFEGKFYIPTEDIFEEGELIFKLQNGILTGIGEQRILPMRGLMRDIITVMDLKPDGTGRYRSKWENFDRWDNPNQNGEGFSGKIIFLNDMVKLIYLNSEKKYETKVYKRIK